ncbi:META domain-containing protein [Mangrovivirga cuniculi]|uniref:DUF306 domain-containing protein n=1 Tax=Mangrovivirga cuniculi TaxID=2715131 RepID=A0A4D7JLY3_9BACT|nr:META domain-containing protein [Mangrovivirga cuniculi]QCK16591.1 hypothetical protein DCC35_18585 [Mangrovivirga cuniculi]
MVIDRSCDDNMPGNKFEYAVKITLDIKDSDEVMSYSGCGKYIGTATLNGVWQLNKINEKSVDNPPKPPNIQFRFEERNISGFTGCNRFKGNVEFSDNSIKTTQFSVTNLACKLNDIEKEFLNSIAEKKLNYLITGDTLTLWTAEDNLVFIRL